MKNLMRMMTVPGLSRSRELANLREESMRNARMNLEKQARSRIVTSMLSLLEFREKGRHDVRNDI